MADGLSAISVLVVDDNRKMRTIIGTVLTAAGVGKVYYAPDGKEGLKLLSQVVIDIAYVDYEMPNMNGLDFISAVRTSDGPQRFVPIIMVTGYSDLFRLNSALNRGVNEFLGKPVTAINILARLNAVIQKPRPFVHAVSYIGPDRRRRRNPNYRGPKRREGDKAMVLE